MLRIEQVHMTLPSLTKEYHFLHFSDAHTAFAYPDESEESRELAAKQAQRWSTSGKPSTEVFEEILQAAKERSAEMLLMAGDCADYYSEGILRYLTEKLADTGIAALYAYGNHEGASYVKNLGDPRQFYPRYRGLMGETPDFQVRDFGEFLLIAVDNSDHHIREEQLTQLEEQMHRGLPILLLMHIPLSTEAILPPMEEHWGKNPTYFMLGTEEEPETTRQFCRMVMAEDSPVAAVFAGHVHFMHKGEFSAGRLQYTAAPGCCWEIFLHPENPK
ncbi:MAG: metallophosphoesterase [Clostridia bacterium]|nr:metallophosphoesterase [Clostridia bacterium]